jgi:hypothetical protein
MTDPSSADTGGPATPPATRSPVHWLHRFYCPEAHELGLRILAQAIANRPRPNPADPIPDADIFALASRCEAAGKRSVVATDAYAVAEFAEPHDQAAEDEALRLQGIAIDEFRDAALPLVWARATTVAGLLAKARAAKFFFPEDNWIVTAIQEAIRDNGIFEHEPMSLSLARDLIALAGKDA